MTCKNCSSCRYLPIINKHICYGVKEPFYIKDIDTKCSEYSDEYWSKQERTETTNYIEWLQAELVEKTDLLNTSIVGQETLQMALAESQRRERAAIETLNSIEWVGSGAKGRIEDAINVLQGPEQEGERKE